MAGQLAQFQHITLALLVFLKKIRQRQLFGNDIKLQVVLARHRRAAGAVDTGADADNGGKGFTAFALGGVKYRGQISNGTTRTGVAAVVTAQYIGSQRTYVFATATLGGFVLTGVVMKQRVVGSRHNGLNGVGGGGFARAVTAGQ